MRLTLTTIASCVLMLAAPGLISDALAHGGAYRGPPGEIPPGSREPSDPPPPPEGNGPTTPGGETSGPTTGVGGTGTPSTGGGEGGGSGTGGDGTGPTTGNGGTGGAATGGAGRPGGASKGPGYEDWTWWWSYNQDDILQIKSSTRTVATSTGTAVHVFGPKKNSGAVKSAAEAAIMNEIVPALTKLLEQEDLNFDIRSAAALALAKIGDVRALPMLERMARNNKAKGDDFHRVVEESAALALGLLQVDSPEVRELLIELMSDKDRNSSFVRPFAAISLGLLGNNPDTFDQTFDALLTILAQKESKPDVKPAALLAIGSLQNARAVPELLEMLERGRVNRKGSDTLTDVEMSFVVQALGRIGAPGSGDSATAVLDALNARVGSRARKKHDPNVRRSAVIALGQIAPQCDDAIQRGIVATLIDLSSDAKDKSERAFAMVALGRIAEASRDGSDTQRTIVRELSKQLNKASPANLAQPYAALSLGLAGRTMANNEEDVRLPLRQKFAATKRSAPRTRGAYAIASGLVKDSLAAPPLVDVLADRGVDKRLRGYAAVALGLIGGDSARETIRTALVDDGDRDLRTQTAIAAGLLGDARVVKDLVGILESGEQSQYILGSVALALGQVGDERAITPLVAIAADTDKTHPDITRALATVALGQVGDRRDVPLLAHIARDLNFRTVGAVPALAELLSIL